MQQGAANNNTAVLPPYLQGSMYEDIPGSVQVYTFSDLGLSTSVTNMQTIVDALPGPGIIQLPGNGWVGTIPNFSHHGSNFGIYQANLCGLLGVISGGTINTQVQMAGNAFTNTQLTTTENYVRGSGTTQIDCYHINNTSAHYIAGINFVGADQQTVQDYSGNGPAVHGGFNLNNAGANSVFQNCLLQGFGRADDTEPPGEVGNWSEAHTVGFTMRRCEIDGRLPNTGSDPYGMDWRRGGGIQWNAANGFLVEDVYHHDTWTSGFTVSFTGTPSGTGSESHDWTTRGLHVEHNSNHGTSSVTNQNSGSFRPINMEFNYGTIHHYQPYLNSDGWGGTNAHIRVWVASTSNGWTSDPNMQVYIHQPQWDTSGPGDGGCFSVYMDGLSANSSANLPIVYLTSDETNPATAYHASGSNVVPGNITPANNYYVLRSS
jgi:hypothetical protein